MHYYDYHKKSEDTLMQAQEKYAWLFESGLSDESIEARYYLLEYLNRTFSFSGKVEKDTQGKPIPVILESGEFLYWSLSHSAHFVSFIVSDTMVGIDIVESQERDISMLDLHKDTEYSILGSKNWKNFYILWTAKESIIKVHSLMLDDMQGIDLKMMNGYYEFLFVFEEKDFRIGTIITDEFTLSYTL